MINVFKRVDDQPREVFHIGPNGGMFSHLEVALVAWIQEIAYLFIVDLNVGHFYLEFENIAGEVCYALKQFGACARNNAFVFSVAHLENQH